MENTVSRQRLWQRKMVRSGKCGSCGAPRHYYAILCDACAKKDRIRRRGRGLAKTRVGMRGRNPLDNPRLLRAYRRRIEKARALRSAGWTWTRIAAALKVSVEGARLLGGEKEEAHP